MSAAMNAAAIRAGGVLAVAAWSAVVFAAARVGLAAFWNFHIDDADHWKHLLFVLDSAWNRGTSVSGDFLLALLAAALVWLGGAVRAARMGEPAWRTGRFLAAPVAGLIVGIARAAAKATRRISARRKEKKDAGAPAARVERTYDEMFETEHGAGEEPISPEDAADSPPLEPVAPDEPAPAFDTPGGTGLYIDESDAGGPRDAQTVRADLMMQLKRFNWDTIPELIVDAIAGHAGPGWPGDEWGTKTRAVIPLAAVSDTRLILVGFFAGGGMEWEAEAPAEGACLRAPTGTTIHCPVSDLLAGAARLREHHGESLAERMNIELALISADGVIRNFDAVADAWRAAGVATAELDDGEGLAALFGSESVVKAPAALIQSLVNDSGVLRRSGRRLEKPRV